METRLHPFSLQWKDHRKSHTPSSVIASLIPISSEGLHCIPSNIECGRCNDRVLCEYCNGCEICDDLNNIGQRCPALSDSADEDVPRNPSLAPISNQPMKGRRQTNLSNFHDPDVIAPVPQKSPDGVSTLSQGSLTATEARVIGDYVTKLPPAKKEQAMKIIRDKLPDAKVCAHSLPAAFQTLNRG